MKISHLMMMNLEFNSALEATTKAHSMETPNWSISFSHGLWVRKIITWEILKRASEQTDHAHLGSNLAPEVRNSDRSMAHLIVLKVFIRSIARLPWIAPAHLTLIISSVTYTFSFLLLPPDFWPLLYLLTFVGEYWKKKKDELYVILFYLQLYYKNTKEYNRIKQYWNRWLNSLIFINHISQWHW